MGVFVAGVPSPQSPSCSPCPSPFTPAMQANEPLTPKNDQGHKQSLKKKWRSFFIFSSPTVHMNSQCIVVQALMQYIFTPVSVKRISY